MTGSPISDLLPIFIATRVEMEVQHATAGLRTVVLDNDFFTGSYIGFVEMKQKHFIVSCSNFIFSFFLTSIRYKNNKRETRPNSKVS